MLVPQWRVTVNSRCKRACSYCRPSGESVATAMDAELAPTDLLRVAHAVRACGLTAVKLTGGDPALYGPLVEVVRRLRDEAGLTEIEVISRHPRIGDLAEGLARAGVTLFNVSDGVRHRSAPPRTPSSRQPAHLTPVRTRRAQAPDRVPTSRLHSNV
ncbi:radical SAM protein [Streptomyces goshikiensis]|uniref:radical SAM protein n=1 Tax=Streptomyces goshikiensis TaxID=1942 RepID=UPI00368C8769